MLNLIQTAHAADVSPQVTNLITNILREIVNPIIALLVGIAVLVFIWGVFEFVRNAESSDERKTGAQHMLWGAIGLFIMSSAYGIMNLIIGTISGK
jgi:uncharacterized membrane protein YidH (DUF202 family)